MWGWCLGVKKIVPCTVVLTRFEIYVQVWYHHDQIKNTIRILVLGHWLNRRLLDIYRSVTHHQLSTLYIGCTDVTLWRCENIKQLICLYSNTSLIITQNTLTLLTLYLKICAHGRSPEDTLLWKRIISHIIMMHSNMSCVVFGYNCIHKCD